MSISLKNQVTGEKLARQLENATASRAESMEKLASGEVFTAKDPRPAERAISDQMDFKLRSMAASKRNINDAVSMLQTAESSLSEISNIVVRMKELNVAGATTTVTDKERSYLFIEYQALHDELNRIAQTTEFNGIPLLNGNDSRAPEELVFRIDDSVTSEGASGDDDLNMIKFEGFKNVIATTVGLGLQDAKSILLDSAEGVSLQDVQEMLVPSEEGFATAYDQALNELSTQRAVFGAMQSRLQRSSDFLDVYHENITAAKANISNVDYAREVTKLTQSSILMQAASGLLAQSNFDANITLNLLAAVTR